MVLCTGLLGYIYPSETTTIILDLVVVVHILKNENEIKEFLKFLNKNKEVLNKIGLQ